jgi:hypothetical protein
LIVDQVAKHLDPIPYPLWVYELIRALATANKEIDIVANPDRPQNLPEDVETLLKNVMKILSGTRANLKPLDDDCRAYLQYTITRITTCIRSYTSIVRDPVGSEGVTVDESLLRTSELINKLRGKPTCYSFWSTKPRIDRRAYPMR